MEFCTAQLSAKLNNHSGGGYCFLYFRFEKIILLCAYFFSFVGSRDKVVFKTTCMSNYSITCIHVLHRPVDCHLFHNEL